jgi:hypothetical protein
VVLQLWLLLSLSELLDDSPPLDIGEPGDPPAARTKLLLASMDLDQKMALMHGAGESMPLTALAVLGARAGHWCGDCPYGDQDNKDLSKCMTGHICSPDPEFIPTVIANDGPQGFRAQLPLFWAWWQVLLTQLALLGTLLGLGACAGRLLCTRRLCGCCPGPVLRACCPPPGLPAEAREALFSAQATGLFSAARLAGYDISQAAAQEALFSAQAGPPSAVLAVGAAVGAAITGVEPAGQAAVPVAAADAGTPAAGAASAGLEDAAPEAGPGGVPALQRPGLGHAHPRRPVPPRSAKLRGAARRPCVRLLWGNIRLPLSKNSD